ncbi:N-acetyl sugar amidotransferase [Candidatus Pelagibacter sp.]|nr:N-acetyl sugar amidotransferase [Candidatus Pelagibacter sp.]
MKNFKLKKVCSRTVMDTTDPNITFNQNGESNYYTNFIENISPNWKNDGSKFDDLIKIADKIKKECKNRDFDCIIGISGGVDSSYLTHLAKEVLGLRPLIFHVDGGWNSQLAVSNIEKVVDKLNLDLHTDVIYWPEMRDLQLAFFKAQVPHLDTPQDHAFFSSMYNYASKYKIKYILNGGNFSTECVREPLEWHYHASDLRHIKDIHSKYGKKKLNKFPTADIFKYKIFYRYIKGMKVIQPLNYVKYIKREAINFLEKEFNWKQYSHKHYESRFTKFYEGYWLINKFGYDKRKAHYSSLILTDQMTRDEALIKLNDPPYIDEIEDDFEYVANKLEITVENLKNLMEQENKTFRDFKSNYKLINFFTKILRLLRIEKRIIQ